ncbi:MAG: hypothetical protein ACD_11C00077G0004, partial [uncultured bacterium]
GEGPFSLFSASIRQIMKKNIKKQLKRQTKKAPKKGKKFLVVAKKKIEKKVKKSPVSKVKAKKIAIKTAKKVSKTKALLKNNRKAVLRKKVKKFTKNKKAETNSILTFGEIGVGYRKTLLLVIGIILVSSMIILQNMAKVEEIVQAQPKVAGIENTRNVVREKEINDMVAGYPIERMTKYIAKQDPKVAAFLIAIAKKESAWGERKPVLDGEDCFNYWGFRLKSDRMGSGGHTCFDSPEEAVTIVGSRINHLVNEEKIDTPKEMVIWKCGYRCDGPEASGSEKWIRDVDYYYKQLIN